MVKENKYGKITHCMKVIGKIIKQMEEVDLYIQMVMFIKDNGKMIKHMEKVYIITMMDPVIQANGLKMYKKDMEYKNGQMVHLIKGNLI